MHSIGAFRSVFIFALKSVIVGYLLSDVAKFSNRCFSFVLRLGKKVTQSDFFRSLQEVRGTAVSVAERFNRRDKDVRRFKKGTSMYCIGPIFLGTKFTLWSLMCLSIVLYLAGGHSTLYYYNCYFARYNI